MQLVSVFAGYMILSMVMLSALAGVLHFLMSVLQAGSDLPKRHRAHPSPCASKRDRAKGVDYPVKHVGVRRYRLRRGRAA